MLNWIFGKIVKSLILCAIAYGAYNYANDSQKQQMLEAYSSVKSLSQTAINFVGSHSNQQSY